MVYMKKSSICLLLFLSCRRRLKSCEKILRDLMEEKLSCGNLESVQFIDEFMVEGLLAPKHTNGM